MAIITFWNDNTGKIGQTHSAIAIASFMAVEHNYKILLMSTKFNDKVSFQAFGGESATKTVNLITNNTKSMDLESGLEGMAKLTTSNRLTPEMVPNYTKVVYKNRLEVVAAPRDNKDVDYDRVYNSCKDILNVAKRYYDIVFVDLNNGFDNSNTKEIIKMSDIVILNVEQKPSEFQNLMKLQEDTETFNPKRILKLINNYDRKSKYSSKNVSRELGEKKEILTVPYCNLFSESVQEENTADFFLDVRVKRLEGTEDRTSFFIHELKRDVDSIIYKMQELQMRV